MALTNTQIKAAKPDSRDYRLADGQGMYLLVKQNGHKYWRLDYRFRGKRNTLALGVYPEISLQEARERRRGARIHLQNDRDPSEVRKEEKRVKQMNLFKDVAYLWWEHNKESWSSGHVLRVQKRLENNIFQELGHLPIDEITPQKVIATVRRVEARGALDVASRVNQTIRAVCRFAVQQGNSY